MMFITGIRGDSEENGSWKTMFMSARTARSACASALARLTRASRPSRIASPAVGLIARMMHLPRVVLPDPDSPTSASTSPLAMSKETSSTALT